MGKNEDGIMEAINIDQIRNQNPPVRKLIYILSDSMLRGIDEQRLCNKWYEVKKHCHGGCTVECMQSHLKKLMLCKPEYVLLHIGTNNCVDSTSDEVLNKLKGLKKVIEKRLPSCTVYISLPTVRTDDTRANIIIRNLNVKLRKLNYLVMDNSNIKECYLGK